MIKHFEDTLKPLNDRLGESLGVKKIQVKDESSRSTILVRISYIAHSGNRVTRLAGKKAFYEAMGLMI